MSDTPDNLLTFPVAPAQPGEPCYAFPDPPPANTDFPVVDLDADLVNLLAQTAKTHHAEVFDYNDDSYVIILQKAQEPFSVERVVFVAERLKLDAFDALPVYDEAELGPAGAPDDDEPTAA